MHIFESPNQAGYFMISLISIPICSLAVLLRFLQTRRAGRRFGLEDWFALGSLIAHFGYVIVSFFGEHFFVFEC
jgi:hypothetical protein